MYRTPPPLSALPERTINNRCIILALGWYTTLGAMCGGLYGAIIGGWALGGVGSIVLGALVGSIYGLLTGFGLGLINGLASIFVIHRWFRPLGDAARLRSTLPATHASITLLLGGFFVAIANSWYILTIPVLVAAACAWFIGRRIATWYGKAALHLQSNPTAGATTLADYGRVEN